MVNNILINATKAFDGIKNRKIKIQTECDDEFFTLKIFDNGQKVSFENINDIFEYGKSTTGGSGIGLYHAKYLCDLYDGDITIKEFSDRDEFSKCFFITLPIINRE